MEAKSYFDALVLIALLLAVVGTAAIVLFLIARGRIDLSTLLSESDGKASISRFQFLIFTFVIAGVWLLLCVQSGTIVDVPEHVLWLLGISGGSYGVSKGIQAWSDTPPTSGAVAGGGAAPGGAGGAGSGAAGGAGNPAGGGNPVAGAAAGAGDGGAGAG